MAKVKAREVLSVQRVGADYHWFNLWLVGMPSLEVGDDQCTWEIDVRANTTVAYVRREYHQTGESKRRLQVKKVKIVGPRDEIMNLLHSLGQATPWQRVGPRWREKEEDLW